MVKVTKVAFDAGHAMGTPGKRTPDDEREWSFNNKVVLAAIEKLNTYDDVQILRLDDPTGKRDVPLAERTNKANSWGADVLVSAHRNALAGKLGSHGGVETFTQPGSSKASKDIAAIIQPRIVTAMGLRNRGLKESNLHMTRESIMPAVLTEGGFMDSTTDIGALRSDAKLKAQGVAIAEGLAAYYNLKPKTGSAAKPKPSTPAKKPTPKPSTGNLGLVDWMKANKMDSSLSNRAKLYGSGYKGTAAQNKPVSKPAAKPVAKKNTVTLPKSAKTWRTYKTNVQPVKANSDWSLTPSAFGGNTYEIVGRPQANVVTVNTSRGKRNIFVGPGTGAVIK